MKVALSPAFEDLRGKAGTIVLTKGHSGLVLKPRLTSRNPRTAAQQATRANMSKAAAAYKALNSTQLAAWRAYSELEIRVNPVSGKSYSSSAINVFTALSTKFLQATPEGTIPTTPPTSAFAGDTVTLTYGTGVDGTLVFTANHANAAGVTTEILLQPLASPARTPEARAYRSVKFNTFTASKLTLTLTLPPGTYAAAYRFVLTATGQATEPTYLPLYQVTATEQAQKAA